MAYKITVKGSLIESTEVSVKPTDMPVDIIKQLCAKAGIVEYIWFGLEFTDKDGNRSSLNIADKMGALEKTLTAPNSNIELKLLYYPPTQATVLQESVKEIMMKDSMQKISQEKVYAPPEIILDLVAHHIQWSFGDMEDLPESVINNFVTEGIAKFIPNGVKARHSVDQKEWEESVKKMWGALRGFHKFDVVDSFLGQVEELQMHNIHYYDIKNKKGTTLVVGVEATGLSILQPDDLQSPKISFEWSTLSMLDYKGNTLVLSLKDSKSTEASKLEFSTAGTEQGYRIGASVRGFYNNYRFYQVGGKISPAYQTMRDEAMKMNEKEKEQKKRDIFESIEKTRKKLEKAIEDAKVLDNTAAKRAENIVSKIMKNVENPENKGEELYEQLKNINKLASKKVNEAAKQTIRMNRKEETANDAIYDDQKSKQVSRLGTLAALRVGNTKARVALFEAM